ncbi:MAG: energy transducer TonB [Gemmatimonadetes bacterium]|nr:energy transducer TonB [Gemmatimonadota bacterium]
MKRVIGFVAALLLVGAAAAGWLIGDDDVPLTDPVPLSDESPFRYPIGLWDRRVEGETVLMVHVTDMGAVDSAYVLLSSGEAAFDSAALAGSGALRFAPARRGEDRVASWARLPVRFRMPADQADRSDG